MVPRVVGEKAVGKKKGKSRSLDNTRGVERYTTDSQSVTSNLAKTEGRSERNPSGTERFLRLRRLDIIWHDTQNAGIFQYYGNSLREGGG